MLLTSTMLTVPVALPALAVTASIAVGIRHDSARRAIRARSPLLSILTLHVTWPLNTTLHNVVPHQHVADSLKGCQRMARGGATRPNKGSGQRLRDFIECWHNFLIFATTMRPSCNCGAPSRDYFSLLM
jgi:hypothetical protein